MANPSFFFFFHQARAAVFFLLRHFLTQPDHTPALFPPHFVPPLVLLLLWTEQDNVVLELFFCGEEKEVLEEW